MQRLVLEARQSKNGKGLFTTKVYRKEDKLFKLEGRILSVAQMDRTPKKIRDNTYRISENKYLSPEGKLGVYVNHACRPNAFIKKIGKDFYIVAMRDIAKNREVTFDYSTILAKDDGWDMKCNCGYKNCRKMIEMYTSLPDRVLARYKKNGYIPKFILEIKY